MRYQECTLNGRDAVELFDDAGHSVAFVEAVPGCLAIETATHAAMMLDAGLLEPNALIVEGM